MENSDSNILQNLEKEKYLSSVKLLKEDSKFIETEKMSDIFLYKQHFINRKDKFYRRFSRNIGDKNDINLVESLKKYEK